MPILIANCEQGQVRGQYSEDQRVTVFKGIPYAKPPVGELRWKAPQPCDSWSGIRPALEYSKIPVQPTRSSSFYKDHFFPADLPQSEDCLYLNIWTPADTPQEKLPVAVWIYGGAFTTGYANKQEFNGETFAVNGCVYVSFNYRVGMFGFLAHPELSQESEEHISGNYGLLDQIAALTWVKKNIAAFGGDPDKVTIFGQSAGAMSCMDLCCSPRAGHLFQRAICESCGGLNIEFYRNTPKLDEAERHGQKVLQNIGFSNIAEARKAEGQQLISLWIKNGIEALEFQPNVDGIILEESSVEAIMKNKHRKIDYLIGSTANEGYAFCLGKSYDPKEYQEQAVHFYREDAAAFLKKVSYDPHGEIRPSEFFGDGMLSAGIAWNELELKRGGNTTYQYYFTRNTPKEECGAFHSCEHAYVFKTLNRFRFAYEGWDFELSNMMCNYWCNFIKTGNPNGPGLPYWNKYQHGEQRIMEFGDSVSMTDVPNLPGVKFAVQYMLEESEKNKGNADL